MEITNKLEYFLKQAAEDQMASNTAKRVGNTAGNFVNRFADFVQTGTKLAPVLRWVAKTPMAGKALGAVGLTGLGFLGGSSLMSRDADPVMNALGLEDASDEHKNMALLAAAAAPVLGAVAGGTSGTGALSGALTGAGALGGSYLGFQGSRKLIDAIDEMDGLDWMDSDWRSAAKLLTTLGGTALGGVTGATLAGKVLGTKNQPTIEGE